MMDQQSNANTSFSLIINNFGHNEPDKFNTGQCFIQNSGKCSHKSKFKKHSGNYRATNNPFNGKPNKQLEINSDSHKNKNKKRYYNSSDMSLESVKKYKKRRRNKRKNIINENGPSILQVDTKIKSKTDRNCNRNEQNFKPDKAYEKFSIYSGNKFKDYKNMHFTNINFGGEPNHQTHTNHLRFAHKRFKEDVKRPEYNSHATVRSEPNINEKEDGDIFYFDICGNRKELSVSKNIQNNFKNLVNYDISGNIIENNWDHQPVSIKQKETDLNCNKSEIYTDVLNIINKNKQQPDFNLKMTETNTNKITLHKKIKKKKFSNDQKYIKINTRIYETYNDVQEELLTDSVMRTKKPKNKDFSKFNHCDNYYKDKDLAPGMSNKDNVMISFEKNISDDLKSKKRKRNKNDIAQHKCDGRVSLKKIKKSNADLIQNYESQLKIKMPNVINDANINTLINVSESECEIINFSDSKQKGRRNKKENVVELDTPKKKCKTKNRERSTEENFANVLGKNKLNNYFEIEGDGFSSNKSIIVELDAPKKKCKTKNREKTTQENFVDDVCKNKLNNSFGTEDDGFSSSKKKKNKHADNEGNILRKKQENDKSAEKVKVIENSKKLFKQNHINSSQNKKDKSRGKHGTNFSESECEIVGHNSKSSIKKGISNLDMSLSEKDHKIKTLENYITGDLNNLDKDKEANKCKQINNSKVHIPVNDKSRPLFDWKINKNTEHIKNKNLNSSTNNSADEIEMDGLVQPNLKKRKKSRDDNTNFNNTTTKQHKIMNSFPGGSEKENDEQSNTINSVKKSKPDNHSFITDGCTSEAELNLLSKKQITPNTKKNKSLKTKSDMITEENKTINTLKEKVSKTKNNSVLTTFEDELGDISQIGSEKEDHDNSDTKNSLKKCKQGNDHSFITGGGTSEAELNLFSKKQSAPNTKKNKSLKTKSDMITEENKTINTLKEKVSKTKNNSVLTTFEDELGDVSQIGSEKENHDKSDTKNSLKKCKQVNDHSFITGGGTSEAELNLSSKKHKTPKKNKNYKYLKTNSDMITEENKTINTLKEKVCKTKNNSVRTFEDDLGDISEIGSENENHVKSDTINSLKKCKQVNDHSFITGGSTSEAELNLASKKDRTPKKNKKYKSPKTNSDMITEENKTINTLFKEEICKTKNNSVPTTFEDEVGDISEIITPTTKTGSNKNPDIDTQKGTERHGKTINSKGTRQSLNETENGSINSNHTILNQEEQPQFFRVSKSIFHKKKTENNCNDIKNPANKEGVRRTSVFAEFMEMDDDDDKVEDKLLPDLEFSPDPEKIELENEKLKDLYVSLPFSVPTLHKISTRTTIPTKEQLEKIEKLNLCVKSGPFSKAEDKMIIENWKRLCKEHDLSMIPSIFTKFPRHMKMETKLNILRYLAHGLDDRMINKVYIRFKLLLKKDHLKLGRYTPEEDKQILDFMETTKSVHPFTDLSELLERTPVSIENRYNLLLHSSEKINFSNPEMADRFVKALLKIAKCEKLKQLKHREFTTKQWRKLSRKLDNISIKKLQRAWKVTIYPRLFSKEINLREVKEELIHLLYDRKETDWRTVDWMDIATHFRGLTADKLYMMFKHLAYFHVPKAKHNNLGECLDFLENKFLRYNKIPATHKFKKFVMKNGHLCYESDVET